MKSAVVSFIVGLIFGLGLLISGMTLPQKIVGFLNVTGNWDPSLLFVMLGAIVVHSTALFWLRLRKQPLFEDRFHAPTKTEIDWKLIFGALIFGAGWGISGYCPGPAVVALASFKFRPLILVLMMIVGLAAGRKFSSVMTSKN